MNIETKRAKILIVDDTPTNVTLLTDLLENNGYLTIQATSGSEALDRVNNSMPDLVLLDVRMPKMNGYEVCKRIRENPDTALLPVVMVTAFDPAQERIHGIEAGADDFLSQPINKQELLARVRSLLRVKALHDAVKAHAGELAEWNKKLEARLSQEAKLAEVARSLADITHEVKNLITPVVTGTQLLERELKEFFAKLPQADRENGKASQNMCREITEMLTTASQRIQERVKEIGDCVKGEIKGVGSLLLTRPYQIRQKSPLPRRPRLAAGDLAYHVLNRRVGRLKLFEKPDDYAAFERILSEA